MQTITGARRKSVEKSIAVVELQKLKSLGEKLFPYFDHPWRHAFFDFLAQNPGATFYHANAQEDVEIVYCDDKNVGVWYIPNLGVGPLQPEALKIMKEIVAKMHRA